MDEQRSSQAGLMSSDQKWAIGLTVFYLLLTTTRVFGFWNESAWSYSDSWKGNVLISILGNLVLLIIILSLVIKYKKVIQNLGQYWPLILLFGYTLISCSWSEFPDIAFRRWVKIFIYFLLIINIASLPNPIKLLRRIFCIYIYIVSILNLVMIFASRKYGWQSYQGGVLPSGIIGHKNGFGLFCAAAFFTMLWYSSTGETPFKESIKKHGLIYIVLLAGLIGSGSKAPLGGMLLASTLSLLVYLLNKMRMNDKYLMASILLILIAIPIFGYLINENLFHADLKQLVLDPTGKDSTFTGRTDIWSASINYGLKNHPAIGSGFYSLFVGDKSGWLDSVYGWQVWGAHNGYIETFLETGFVGLAILFLVLVKIAGYIYRSVCLTRTQSISLLSLIILILFVNSFEVILPRTSLSFFWIIVLSGYKSLEDSSKSSALAAG